MVRRERRVWLVFSRHGIYFETGRVIYLPIGTYVTISGGAVFFSCKNLFYIMIA